MSYLLEDPATGERAFADTMRGYPGWTVLGEGEEFRPIPYATFDAAKKKWVVDEVAKAKEIADGAETARIRALPPEALMAEITAKLEAITTAQAQEIASLRTELDAVKTNLPKP